MVTLRAGESRPPAESMTSVKSNEDGHVVTERVVPAAAQE
jgi:hypothetical protein